MKNSAQTILFNSLNSRFGAPSKFKYGKKKNLPSKQSRKQQKGSVNKTEATETSAASLWEASDSIITRGKVVNVLCGSCVLLLQKWNQLWLVDVSEFLWLESEALSSWMQCRGLALGKTVLQVKGIFGLRPVSQSLSFFHFKTTNFSPSHITSIFMPSSFCPNKTWVCTEGTNGKGSDDTLHLYRVLYSMCFHRIQSRFDHTSQKDYLLEE